MSRMQEYYDQSYHDKSRTKTLLTDYSLQKRIEFFQNNCLTDGASVLDFGCGAGALLTAFKEISQENSFGVDVSKSTIDFVNKKWPNYNWMRIGIDDKLPFENETFDCVISSEVIEHVFDVDNYLSEFWRVLKPRGILGLSCPYHGFLKDLAILLTGKFENHFHNPYDPHIRYYSIKALRHVLTNNQFNLVERRAICSYFHFKPLAKMIGLKALKI